MKKDLKKVNDLFDSKLKLANKLTIFSASVDDNPTRLSCTTCISKTLIDDNELIELYKLKDVIRYNCRKHLKNESVAEHSYYVALLAMRISDILEVSEEVKSNAIIKALMHDLPEMETNDITHNAKEKMHLRKVLKKYEDEYYDKNFPKYAKLMKDDSDNLTNLIVLYADTLSVRQFCLNEIDIGNKDNDIKGILKDTDLRISYVNKKLKEAFKDIK